MHLPTWACSIIAQVLIGIFCCRINMKKVVLVPAISHYTDRSWIFQSRGKVLARTSAVASYTEMVSHSMAIYDGRKFTLKLVHLSKRQEQWYIMNTMMSLNPDLFQALLAVVDKPLKKVHCTISQSWPSLFASIVLHWSSLRQWPVIGKSSTIT